MKRRIGKLLPLLLAVCVLLSLLCVNAFALAVSEKLEAEAAEAMEAETPLEEIPEEEVPMASAPTSGRDASLWASLAIVAALGCGGVFILGRKKQDEQ